MEFMKNTIKMNRGILKESWSDRRAYILTGWGDVIKVPAFHKIMDNLGDCFMAWQNDLNICLKNYWEIGVENLKKKMVACPVRYYIWW